MPLVTVQGTVYPAERISTGKFNVDNIKEIEDKSSL
jgi:hypothetical protein